MFLYILICFLEYFMPWSKDNLPQSVEGMDLTDKQIEIFVEVANSVLKETEDDGKAIASGISAAKKEKKSDDSDDTLEKEYKNTILKIESTEGNEVKFSGYASVFDVIDSYGDIIKPGSFKKTLEAKKANNVKLLWQHSPEEPIGVIDAIKEDKHGLYIEGRLLLDVKRAQEARALMKEGAISGLSIGYSVKKGSRNRTNGIRTIEEVKLFEISVVTFPANEEAQILKVAKYEYGFEKKTKEDIEEIKGLKDVEDFLQSLGCSQCVSKGLISKINEFKTQRDVELEETKSQCDVEKNKFTKDVIKEIKKTINIINKIK